MKKFKGFISAEEESYTYYRAQLKKHGASQLKGSQLVLHLSPVISKMLNRILS